MPRVKAPQCPTCHAPLPADYGRIRCEYCGREIRLERTIHQAPAPARQPRSDPRDVHQMAGKRARKAVVLSLVAAGVLAAAGIGITFSTMGETRRHAGSGPGGGGKTPGGEQLQWDASYPVVPAAIDGDDTPDFVARYRILEDEQLMYVGAFDGATLERLWKVGPLGEWSDGISSTHIAVSADHVLVTDGDNRVHVLDRATGQERHTLRLTDAAEAICAVGDDAPAVWIQVADEQHRLVDPAAGEARPADRPDACPPEVSLAENRGCWHSEYHRNRQGHAGCTGAKPSIDGMAVEYVLAAGDRRAAVGHKEPGTQVPMVAGLDGDDRVLWKRVLGDVPATGLSTGTPALVDLVGTHLVSTYETDDAWRVIDIDVDTGQTRWGAALPRSDQGSGPRTMTVTADRLYVPHWTWLDVFELESGDLVGTLGVW